MQPTQTQTIMHPDMKAGVQYMCCMVPLDERGQPQAQLPTGSVAIGTGQVPTGAGGGPNGIVPISHLPSGIQAISGGPLANITGGAVPIGQLPVQAQLPVSGGAQYGQMQGMQFFGQRPGGQ